MERPDVTMMYVVHKAFRRELSRMQAAAAQADNPDMHQALHDSWTTFSRYLTIHHTAEDEMLWPPMRAKLGAHDQELGLLDEMLDEHSQLEPVLRKIPTCAAQNRQRIAAILASQPGQSVRRTHRCSRQPFRTRGDNRANPGTADAQRTRMGRLQQRSAPPHRPARRRMVLSMAARRRATAYAGLRPRHRPTAAADDLQVGLGTTLSSPISLACSVISWPLPLLMGQRVGLACLCAPQPTGARPAAVSV
jgi:hypothetical protein